MDDIKTWLSNNGSYDKGLILLVRHCKNRNLCNYLSRKKDIAKLRYELSKISGTKLSFAPSSVISKKVDDLSLLYRVDFESIAQMPEIIRTAANTAITAYRKARAAHTYLKDATSDDQRKKIRQEMLRHIDVNRANWEIVNRFKLDGTLPESKPTEPPSDSTLAQQYLTAASALSRALSSIEKTTNEERRADLLQKVRDNIVILRAGGRQFNPKTAAKLKVLGIE